MGKKDPRIDAYIAKARPFARPVLRKLRALAHKADPEVEEAVRWAMPTFVHNGIVFGMAAFKRHAAVWFWKGKLILDHSGRRADEAMGNFGRITSLKDLPSDRQLTGYIKKAVKLNLTGAKVPGRTKRKAVPRRVSTDLGAALKKNADASTAFKGMSASHRNEYVEWITGAKREETRKKRVSTAVLWLARGRSMNWRYER